MQVSELTPTDIRACRSELAKRSLKFYARSVDIPTVPITDEDDEDRFDTRRNDILPRHIDVLLSHLQMLSDGDIHRLMIFMPPGSAKSTYVDVVFIPWMMSCFPRLSVILASYGTTLAKKQGRRARQLLRSTSHMSLFPDAALRQDQKAADEWALTNGSEFMAGGILAAMTGNRADVLAIDDPVKGREEADSETIRQKVWDAYQDDLTTRLKPNGRQLIIQTRWHDDDLSGRILPEEWDGESGPIECRDGQVWHVLCIPAEAGADDPIGRKPGEMLWPEWFGPDHWTRFRKSARTWSALFQQRPAPDEGTYFQRDWFKRHAPIRAGAKGYHFYGFSDYAVTEDGGDYTEHGLFAIDHNYRAFQVDWWHGQTSSDKWIEAVIDMMALYHPFAWFGEAGVIQKAVEPMMRRRMMERKVRCRLEWLPSIHDKTTRARGFQQRAAMGEVSFLNNDMGERVLQQCLKFPAGKHDDAVDVCSMLGRALDMAHPAIERVAEEKPNPFEPEPITVNDLLKENRPDRSNRRII